MKNMKHPFKAYLLITVILTVLVAGCIAGCWTETESRWIIPEPMFYSEEDLKNLYFDHKDEFQEVVEIVLGSDSLLQHLKDTNDNDWGICTTDDARFFTKEDWEKIVAFSQDVKFTMIMRSLEDGEDTVYFVFRRKRENGKQIGVHLYKVANEKNLDSYSYENDTFEEIDENWWICFRVYPS